MGQSWWQAYADRDSILREIGYQTYHAYLASPFWSAIRRRVIERDRRACKVCQSVARNVHHRSYSRDTLTGKRLDDLVSLCRECHNKVEFAENLKLSLDDANRKLDAMQSDAAARRRRISLTKAKSVVKVPRQTPSVQRTRLSKRQRRRARQHAEFAAYQQLRQRQLAHKAEIKAQIQSQRQTAIA